MKKLCAVSFLLAWLLCDFGARRVVAQAADKPLTIPESNYEWWRAARFGVFIHWNSSSVLQLGEGSWSRKNPTDAGQDYHRKGLNRKSDTPPAVIIDGSYLKYKGRGGVPLEIYDNLFHVFNPTGFNADEWAKTFKEAGAGYVVFTTKHHDGFCMFDSKFTDYDIMSTPLKRDIAKELATACHKYGLKIIWYYSRPDWFDPRHDVNNPGPYAEYLTNQVTELLTNYGEISGIWWDSGQIEIPTRPLFDTLLKIQPKLISNGRIQSSKHHVPGVSFGTPEQELGAFNMKEPWESCVTMLGENWFWNGGKDIRSADSCLRLLINCAIGDGNLLLDFGPDELGRMHPTVKQNYLHIGQWLKTYGASIYGTRGGPYKPSHWGGSTRRGNTVYLHITQRWPGSALQLPPLPRKVVAAKLLTGGEVQIRQTGQSLTLQIAPGHHQAVDTIVALELDGSAMDIAPIAGESDHWQSLTVNAAVTASSAASFWAGLAPECVVLHSWEKGAPVSIATAPGELSKAQRELLDRPRGHVWRAWVAQNSDAAPWLAVDLGKPRHFDTIYLREKFNRIRAFALQIEKDGAWQTLYNGGELDFFTLRLSQPVTAQRVRVLITESTKDGDAFQGPGLQEFDLY